MPQLIITISYASLLLILLIVNLLYIFQILKYRLPGDASLPILLIHLVLMGAVLLATTFYLGVIR